MRPRALAYSNTWGEDFTTRFRRTKNWDIFAQFVATTGSMEISVCVHTTGMADMFEEH